MVQQERAHRTRANILDAAAAAFDKNGYAGTSLSDVLRRAGTTKGALYFHFPSKRHLADALIDEQFSIWSSSISRDTGIQTLIDISHEMVSGLRGDTRVRAGVRLVIEEGTFVEPNSIPYQQWIKIAEECLQAGQRRGDLRRSLNPYDIAHLVIASFTGIQISSQVFTGRNDMHKRVTDLWTLLLPGIVPSGRVSKFMPAGAQDSQPPPMNGTAKQ